MPVSTGSIERMSERRAFRVGPRTDLQILDHAEDMAVLVAIAGGRYIRSPDDRLTLRRLAREDLLLAGFAASARGDRRQSVNDVGQRRLELSRRLCADLAELRDCLFRGARVGPRRSDLDG